MQTLEGSVRKVETTYPRIKADPRHRALIILSQRNVATREFGPWQMAARVPGEESEAFLARVEQLIEGADRNVSATFEVFARINRAA